MIIIGQIWVYKSVLSGTHTEPIPMIVYLFEYSDDKSFDGIEVIDNMGWARIVKMNECNFWIDIELKNWKINVGSF